MKAYVSRGLKEWRERVLASSVVIRLITIGNNWTRLYLAFNKVKVDRISVVFIRNHIMFTHKVT